MSPDYGLRIKAELAIKKLSHRQKKELVEIYEKNRMKMTSKCLQVYVKTFGCPMDAVLYDYRSVFEQDLVRKVAF